MLRSIHYVNEQGKRENLEDTIYPLPGHATLKDELFLVCDGVGGESKGEEASRIVCEAIPEYFGGHTIRAGQTEPFHKAAAYAVDKLKAYTIIHPEAERMSTTLTLCFLQKGTITIAWCGDSRVYHIRDGDVLWRSTDHSMVMELVKKGELTEEEAANHPIKNLIMRSLGAGGNSNIDIQLITDFYAGDYLLLCTDGVLENVDDRTIKSILGPGQQEKNKSSLFLDICRDRTKDNFSLYLLELGENGDGSKDGKARPKRMALWLSTVGVLLVIVLAITFKRQTTHPAPATASPASVSTPALPAGKPGKTVGQGASDSSLLNVLNKNIKRSNR